MTSPRKSATPRPSARDAARARRHAALELRRDLGGAVPHPGLSSTTRWSRPRRASRATSRASSIRASPIRPSPCSSSAWPARRRGGGARHGERHGGGDGGAARPGQGRRPRRRRAGAVRLLSLRRRGTAAALRRRLDAGRRRGPRRNGGPPMRPNTKTAVSRKPDQPGARNHRHRRRRRDRARGGATLVVDNVFATPLLPAPLQLGADCVVYSATKHIDGQGRCLGGVILACEEFIADHVHNFLRQTGPRLSPFNAWVMLKSLETLPVRVARADARAARIADFLAGQPDVARVLYPGRADHPQPALARRQMSGGGTLVASKWRAARRPRSGSPTRCRSSRSPTISATPRASSPIPRRRPTSA